MVALMNVKHSFVNQPPNYVPNAILKWVARGYFGGRNQGRDPAANF